MSAFRRLLIISLFLILAGIFYSCETSDIITSLNQDRIYQIYDARYNADSNFTYVRATFRLENASGSYITLAGGNANVTFNGNPMTEVSAFGVVYYQYGTGGFQNPYQFVYTDADNNTFANSTSLSGMEISFQNPPTIVLQSSGAAFNFTSSVNSGETVTLNIYNAGGSLVIQKKNQNSGSSSIQVTSSDLSSLATGTYRAQLIREDKSGLSQQNNVGGVMNRAYLSVIITFELQ